MPHKVSYARIALKQANGAIGRPGCSAIFCQAMKAMALSHVFLFHPAKPRSFVKLKRIQPVQGFPRLQWLDKRLSSLWRCMVSRSLMVLYRMIITVKLSTLTCATNG